MAPTAMSSPIAPEIRMNGRSLPDALSMTNASVPLPRRERIIRYDDVPGFTCERVRERIARVDALTRGS